MSSGCRYCGSLAALDALRCESCGAPVTNRPEQPEQQVIHVLGKYEMTSMFYESRDGSVRIGNYRHNRDGSVEYLGLREQP